MNTDLEQTTKAIVALSSAMAELNKSVALKKDQISEKDEKLEMFRATLDAMIIHIDSLIAKLRNMLENDGTDNHNH